MFKGENKSRWASISVWIKPPAKEAATPPTEDKKSKKKKKKSKKGKDTPKKDAATTKKEKTKKGGKPKKEVKMQVYDANGKNIRNTTARIDTGLNRVTWFMDRKGVRFPSRRALRPDQAKREPGGISVIPGKYKVVLTYGEHKDSTTITVHGDPRQNISPTVIAAQQKMTDEFAGIVEKATASIEQLKSASKTVKLVKSQMVNAPDSVKKAIGKLNKSTQGQIDSLIELFVGPAQTKGIVRFNNTLNSKLFTASSYIRGSTGVPTKTAEIAFEQAKTKVAEVVNAVNAFFEKDWAAYQKEIEGVSFPLFKAYERVKVDDE